ncbi:hypothetical protein NW768_010138 [Fusarium equiseti]|uniref:Uncharacterized protein n=1 Tax=Fusarium equiseti TaxID=61235 RepID=A0ABQ8R0T3_FUSEQ|nr:hypothetical protein NW768_010138 [Fusarium equiseti]
MDSFKSSSDSKTGFVPSPSLDPAPSGVGAADMTLDPESIRRVAVHDTAQALGVETSVSTYRDLVLSLIKDCSLKRDLVAFVDAPRKAPHESLVPVDAFINDSDRTDWHTHCLDMDKSWKEFCGKVSAISDKVTINRMAKPSGPMKARASFLWHYPTNTSPNQVFSHVLDTDSPTVRVQETKNGLTRDVKTLDLIPIRIPYKERGPGWKETFEEQWPALLETCIRFTADLLKDDDFIFAIGKGVFPHLKGIIESWGLTLTWLELQVDVKMWENAPRIYIARDASKRIRKVIFWTFHGQFAFYNEKVEVGAVWDMMYNAGYELAGVPVLNYGFFVWRADRTAQRNWDEIPDKVGKISDRDMHKLLVEKEIFDEKPCTIEFVQQCFPRLIEKTPGLLGEIETAVQQNGYSPLNAINRVFIRRQQMSRQANSAIKRKAAPLPAPETKKSKREHTEKAKAYFASDRLAEGQKKGNDTKKAIVRSKYDAFMQSFEVRQAEANRFVPNQSIEFARALPRIDKIRETMEAATRTDVFKHVGTDLSPWVTFYSKEYPRGYRYAMDGGPAIPEPDPYANQRHPAIAIMNKGSFRDKASRLEAAGPADNDEES